MHQMANATSANQINIPNNSSILQSTLYYDNATR